jgi:hypothetical protein
MLGFSVAVASPAQASIGGQFCSNHNATNVDDGVTYKCTFSGGHWRWMPIGSASASASVSASTSTSASASTPVLSGSTCATSDHGKTRRHLNVTYRCDKTGNNVNWCWVPCASCIASCDVTCSTSSGTSTDVITGKSTSSSNSLAVTGSNTTSFVIVGVAVFLLGAAMVTIGTVARRRRVKFVAGSDVS